MRKRFTMILILTSFIFAFPQASFSQEKAKKQLERYYREGNINDIKLFLVCLTDEIPATAFPSSMGDLMGGGYTTNYSKIEIDDGSISRQKGKVHDFLEKGELLWLGPRKIGKDYVRLTLYTVGKHSLIMDQGAFQSNTLETLGLEIRFNFPRELLEGYDIAPIQSEIEKWFKPFEDYASAVEFGNTLSTASVPEIKIGMSREEVEKMFGPPEKKFTFPDRVVYRYEDFSVEFRDDVVADILY